ADGVSTSSSAFATPGGSGVGMSLKAFKDELGSAYRGYKDSTGVRHLRFDTVGVDLSYDIRGAGLTTVRSLSVFKPAAAMPAPAPTILPGVGIGPLRLGMSAEEAIRAVGRSPQARRADMLIWVLDEKDVFGANAWLWAWLDNKGAVDFIYTDALSHQTAQGNAPGTGILEFAGRVRGGLPEPARGHSRADGVHGDLVRRPGRGRAVPSRRFQQADPVHRRLQERVASARSEGRRPPSEEAAVSPLIVKWSRQVFGGSHTHEPLSRAPGR
ncbi:MAG: hypothetical protein ACRDHY_10715, partial [Anaerolineales bacterium]